MSKLIAAMNMTLDGFCDHTAINADDEKLLRTINFSCGAVVHYYEPTAI